jgi:hypothetical protein
VFPGINILGLVTTVMGNMKNSQMASKELSEKFGRKKSIWNPATNNLASKKTVFPGITILGPVIRVWDIKRKVSI